MKKQTQHHSESTDGIRFNWNVFPSTRLEASQLSTSVGCLYTPLHSRSAIPQVHGHPLECRSCSNVINHFIKIDRVNRMWWCPFCTKQTYFPENFRLPPPAGAIQSVEDIPVELRDSSSTIEYVLPSDISNPYSKRPRAFVYVVDLYQHSDELNQGKEFNKLVESILETIEQLPSNTLVMLITFTEVVSVHQVEKGTRVSFTYEELFGETGSSDKSPSRPKYKFDRVFQDNVLFDKILNKLSLKRHVSSLSDDCGLISNGYLVKLTNTNASAIIKTILSLTPQTTHSFKPPRASGLALLIASLLLSSASFQNFWGKVSFFTSGPANMEPGSILESSPTAQIRSHSDILNLTAPKFVSAHKFYKVLGLVAAGYSFDIARSIVMLASSKITDFACPDGKQPRFSIDIYTGSLDQVGVYEMSALSKTSCGNVSISESFSAPIFRKNLTNNFASSLKSSTKHAGNFSVTTSAGAKILRILCGHGTPLPSTYQTTPKSHHLHVDKIADSLGDFDSGMNKSIFTNQWWFNSMGESSDTLAVYFDIETVSSSSRLDAQTGVKEIYIQFRFKYRDDEADTWKLRVTTIRKPTTLAVLFANQVRLSNGATRLSNSKSEVLKERSLMESFDHEGWMVLLARLMINKIDTTLGFGDFETVVKQADLTLVRLLHYFGGLSLEKVTGQDSSNPYLNLMAYYTVNENFKQLPLMMYHLRRNPHLIDIFNSSPDETAVYHQLFMTSSTSLSCLMMQPKLYRVNTQEESIDQIELESRVLQDAANQDKFLILDSGFNIVIYYNVSQSERLKLHPSNNDAIIYGASTDPKLKSTLQAARNLITSSGRTAEPKFVLTQTGHSQARFLLASLIPAEAQDDNVSPEISTNKNADSGIKSWFQKLSLKDKSESSTGRLIYNDIKTDDISFTKFNRELLAMVKNYKVNDDY